MKCQHCGAEVSQYQKSCMFCGAEIKAAPVYTQPAPQSAPQPEQPQQAAPQAAPQPEQVQGFAAAPPQQESANYRDPFAPQPGERSDYSAAYYGEKPVSVGNWLGTMFLLILVPIALAVITGVLNTTIANGAVTLIFGIITCLSPLLLILIWAFSRNTLASKRNFFRALLIFYLIMLIICIVAFVMFLGVAASLVEQIDINELSTMLNELGGVLH